MYPHERSLVERLKDNPFALLGVNSDKDRDELKEVLKKEKISWRSFWNGGSTDGPIAKTWNVHGWPTVYVMDPKGVIRFKNVPAPKLDHAVHHLLKQLHNHKNTPKSCI